jgi:hypothetical protein
MLTTKKAQEFLRFGTLYDKGGSTQIPDVILDSRLRENDKLFYPGNFRIVQKLSLAVDNSRTFGRRSNHF